MKKNSLTTAIIAGVAGVAGLAGVAHAVNLNPDGIGQVLLYPYYTTNGGNSTLISVVNTSDIGKAVKVRFLESLNSKEVLDFNLYLSPFDVWTANVHDNGGVPGIRTSDTSCIAPNKVMTEFTAFRDYEFKNWRPDLLGRTTTGDAPAINESRMRQGHIEIIEMGDLGGDAHRYSLHDRDGVPEDCTYFHNQWTSYAPGTWLDQTGGLVDQPNYNRGRHDVHPPGSGYIDEITGERTFGERGGPGGIFGSAYIVNGAEGTSYSYNAEAINGFYTIGEADTGDAEDNNLHFAPGTIRPALYDATNAFDGTDYYAFARVFDSTGNPYDLAWVRDDAPNAVSAVLSARHVSNEYSIGGATSAVSDWVVTFPTKELHTYRNVGEPGLAPFSAPQGRGALNTAGDNKFEGFWAEQFTMNYWDREEGEPSAPPGVLDVSPLPPPGEVQVLAFRQEANVLTFFTEGTAPEDRENVLAAPLGIWGGGYQVALEEGFNNGWARISFASQSMTSENITVGSDTYVAHELTGLPVIGFWAAKHTNHAAAEGVSAFYNLIHRHRVTRDIQVAPPAPAPVP